MKRFVLLHSVFIIMLLSSVFLLSCKKDQSFFTSEKPINTTSIRTDEQLVRDSIYYYYNLYSLWTDESIPDYNHLFRFTDSFQTNDEVLGALKALTPTYNGYPEHVYDRFSYLQNISNSSGSTGKLLMDINNGYGIFFTIGAATDQEAYPIVYFVEGGSPAAKSGMRRSDVVKKLNNSTNLAIPIDCSTGTCKISDETQYRNVLDLLFKSLNEPAMQITLEHQDASTETMNLQYSSYEINPITKDSIYQSANKNVGYLALSSFEQIENGNQNQQHIDQVFQDFQSHQIKDLIVDLRYNTGGYVDAAIYIANKIINTNGNQKLMLKYQVNKYLSQDKENGDFRDVYFQRSSQLELGTVYFLVTNITASASEMLINVLRPYMNVQIIAENNGTYGKPVGFFQQIIMNKIALWPVSFLLENANQYSDYWNGLEANQKNVTDYVFRDFGDTKEPMIAAAINQAMPGYNNNLRSRSLRSSNSFEKVKFNNINNVSEKGLLKTHH
ncbi:S41 family peptidase [Sphingobacterium sp. SRCM116780]|uniref:S41 family peptidase n=1 Tax=Sphingobacterium sp. SRCM116780 TaxID=2907623 RepID=UPI001F476905|nr:S41 family peptidase [Sphingobacterium sp. SRCM116780]UIR56019.1 S41 family peptidase [Sphingobacterium sp. SRCM116780]